MLLQHGTYPGHLYGTGLGRTGRSSRDSDRIELIVLVPTVACLNPMMAGAFGSWSSLVRCSLMRCPALNRRAFGTRGMRYWTSWAIGTATASRQGKTGSADTTGVLVDLPEAGTEVPGGDVMGGPVRLDVLEGGDPRRICRRAPGLEAKLDVPGHIQVPVQWIARPRQEARRVGGTGLAPVQSPPRSSSPQRPARRRPDSASRRRSGRMHGRWPRAEARSRRSAPPRYDTRAHWPYDRVDDGLTEPAGPGEAGGPGGGSAGASAG